MISQAINLEPLYPGLTLCEKIRKVAEEGFKEVEFWGWDQLDLEEVKRTCKETGVKIRAFSGTKEWSLCDVSHRTEYIEWVRKSMEAARKLECDTLILFPNHFTSNGCADFRKRYSQEAMIANITATLTILAPELEEKHMTVLLEPLANVGADEGMSVTDTEQGAAIIRAVGSPNVQLLCDVFHMQMMHGNLLNNIMSNLDIVQYIHIADAPDRHEPGTGEINLDYLAEQIQNNKFEGTVCMEYFPAEKTEKGMPAVKKFLKNFK